MSSGGRWRYLAVALAILSGACTRGELGELPAPPTTGPTTSTTARPDLSAAELAGVPGATTTTVAIGPGRAVLKGVVRAPDGLVPAATVLIERLAGSGVASAQVITDASGNWMAPDILGGRYRVRAWRAPDFALTSPASFFLESQETKELALELESFAGIGITSAIAPDPPIVDEPAQLVVRAFTRTVDGDGIVRSQGISNVEMELTGSGTWRVESANPTQANEDGEAQWLLRCTRSGSHPLGVIVASQPETNRLELSACTTGEEASPAEEPTTSTTVRPRTTTTTDDDASST